ncbi:hypothetical protein GH714_015275 [Hevea brasiliensis]|uniref:EF-hand domain-containing protein n=1 Tax=Hevea brasiliensis TaxID=3981 RepID=A0A6A6MA69_HEVBR|nr:hypothetical protein GH714_015275 [Hevea brasiliensis]
MQIPQLIFGFVIVVSSFDHGYKEAVFLAPIFSLQESFSFFRSFSTDEKNTSTSCDNSKNKGQLKSVFATFDKNGDGFITKHELRESLKNIRIFMTEKEVEEMVAKVDSNGDGLIDYEEFCFLCEDIMGDGGQELEDDGGNGEAEGQGDLKEAFDVFDRDKDGLISVEELGLVLSSLGLKEGKRIEDCKEMIKKVDMDGDGMVNFDEFKRMMRSGSTKLIPVC